MPGIVVPSPALVKGFFGGLKSIVGGRIATFTEMGEQARLQAYDQMINHLRQPGANAMVGTRYDGRLKGALLGNRRGGGGVAAGGHGSGLPFLCSGGCEEAEGNL